METIQLLIFTFCLFFLSRTEFMQKTMTNFIVTMFKFSIVDSLLPSSHAAIIAKVVLNVFWITMLAGTIILFMKSVL